MAIEPVSITITIVWEWREATSGTVRHDERRSRRSTRISMDSNRARCNFLLSTFMARVQTAKKASHALSKKYVSQPPKDAKPKTSDKKEAKSKKSKGKSHEKSGEQRDSLRDEIIELGGDDEDYELLKDIHSDEELVTADSGKKDVSILIFVHPDLSNLNLRLNYPRTWRNS